MQVRFRPVLTLLFLLEVAGLVLLAVLAGFLGMFLEVLGTAVLGLLLMRSLSAQGIEPTPGTPVIGAIDFARRGARFGCGFLLFLPGLLTDIAGLVLLIPPVRRAALGLGKRILVRRMARATGIPPEMFGGGSHAPFGRDDDRTTDATEVIVEARVKSSSEADDPEPPEGEGDPEAER